MTPDDAQVEKLVRGFQADLGKMTDGEVVHKHILTGIPVVVPEPAYFEIRNRVAKHFDICPTEVLIVGSCRTGFSIKDEEPYRAARIDSDIDITIVSDDLFRRYWEAVFRFYCNNHEYRSSPEYVDFAKDLARGWIMPRSLPPMRSFTDAARWVDFFHQLQSRRLHGPEPRTINGKLYRSWRRLQAYQEILVGNRRTAHTRARR